MSIPDSFVQDAHETQAMLEDHYRVLDFQIVGSALYKDDAADLDFLVHMADETFAVARWAFGTEWSLCAGEYDDTGVTWGAVRKGNVNLIITVDKDWYGRAVLANEVCHALKLQNKADRVVVYRVVRDGCGHAEANARRDGRL